MKSRNNIINNWIDLHGDPEVEQYIEKNLIIVEKVYQTLANKGWTQAELAEMMGKNPSEVSKWLSGTHNLTLKSIVKMERALEIDLIQDNPEKIYQTIKSEVAETEQNYR
jgi:transcriptional regulator with XRE-family HTH domain